jgi:hypothetical protein
MSSLAAQKIITNGLDCGAAKPGLIQTNFGLFCFGVFPDRFEGAGGGPYPYTAWNRLEPGEIANFFQEIEVDGELIVPLDQEAEYFRKKHIVILKVNIGKLEFEKAYAVPKERAKIIITAINLINDTRTKIEFAVNGIKSLVSKMIVSVKKVRITRK